VENLRVRVAPEVAGIVPYPRAVAAPAAVLAADPPLSIPGSSWLTFGGRKKKKKGKEKISGRFMTKKNRWIQISLIFSEVFHRSETTTAVLATVCAARSNYVFLLERGIGRGRKKERKERKMEKQKFWSGGDVSGGRPW